MLIQSKKSRNLEHITNQVPQSDPDGRASDIVIPVMGQTGVGKSTFINAVLGENVNRMVVGHEIESCTFEIATAEVDTSQFPSFPWLKDGRLLLVDTPGFDDTSTDDCKILERIAKWLETTYRAQLVLGGVIYLHDISNNRVKCTAKKNLTMFNQLCGEGALDRVVLGTTMTSRLPPAEADKRLARLKEVHWKDMIHKRAQAFQFDGRHSSALNFVNAILQRFEEESRTVQCKLVDTDNKIPEEDAGKESHYTLQQLLIQRKLHIKMLAKAETGDPVTEADLLLAKKGTERLSKQPQKSKVPLILRQLLAIIGIQRFIDAYTIVR